MIKVKLSVPLTNFPFLRQTPGGTGVWEDCKFYLNEEIESCDYWFVFDSLLKDEQTRCIPENVVLVTGEPSSVKRFNRAFLNQFGAVITAQKTIPHSQVVRSQTGLPWYSGVSYNKELNQWSNENYLSYDDFLLPLNHKREKLLVIITSSKTMTQGHINRLKFLEKIKQIYGDQVDIFGHGFQSISDKFEILKAYKYTIVLENSSYPDYWTEKLADALLAETYPIYYGCPNVYDYFSREAITTIDIDDTDTALETINTVIKSAKFENAQIALREAKLKLLQEHNFFPLIVNYIHNRSIPKESKIELVKIKMEKGLIPMIKRVIKKIIRY